MRTEAEVRKAVERTTRGMKMAAEADLRPLFSKIHLSREVLYWILGEPSTFTTVMDGFDQLDQQDRATRQ